MMGMAAAATVAAMAGAPAEAQRVMPGYRIPAGTLDEALRAYARATGVQMLFRPQDVEGRISMGVDGRMSFEDGLARILAGTGLVWERTSARVVVVRPGRSPEVAPGVAQSTPDIVVTGSNLRGGSATAPVKVVTRDDVERSGRATIADVIAAQTANFGGTGNATASLTGVDRSSSNVSLAPAANLRGLGSDATLTLFDGRRVAGSGGRGNFSDLSALPSLALERAEILADGASAVYGSDAVGGVVNLILRHRYDGFEIRLRGGSTQGGPLNALAGAVAGATWSGGSVLVAYEYEHRDALSASERGYTATGDLRPFGGTDRRTFLSSPGTILRLDAASRSYVPAFAIPVLAPGVRPTAADLRAGTNLSNLAAGVSLSPRIDRHAVYARVEQELADGLRAFADGRFARRDFAYGAPAAQTIFAVTPANPFYVPLAGQTSSVVAYSFIGDLGPSRARGEVSALSVAGGLTWDVGSWLVDGYGTFARERSSERISNQLNSTFLAEALGNAPDNPATPYSAVRDGYFDPYGSGAANAGTVLDFVGSGFTAARRRSSVTEGVLKTEGPVLALPAGEVRLAVGGALRRETLRTGGTTFASGIVPTELTVRSLARDVRAVFAETRIPLFGSSNAVPGIASMQLTAAVRHEDHDGFGGTTDPRIGLALSPTTGLTLRGSWGTSFRAPALPEVGEPRRVAVTSLRDVTGATVPVIFIAGGNPDLGPERADTTSFGFDVDAGASGAPGLTTSLTVFRTEFRDRISQPALQDSGRALTNPDLAPFVRRVSPLTNAADLAAVNALLAEPGATAGLFPSTSYAAIVDGRNVNTGSVLVSGLDWDLGYARTTGIGRVSATLSATWLFRYVERLTPAAQAVDRLGTLGRPSDLRVRGGVGWSGNGISLNAFGNFVGGYLDDASVPGRSIASFLTVDLSLGYSIERGALRGLRLLVSAENAFDADPPFVDRVSGFGFDAANANPFGRRLALEVRKTF
jgi:outer membrane receptor protein involved in Fe transport